MRKISLLGVAVLAIAAMTVQSVSAPTGNLKVPANLLLELKVDKTPVLVPSGKEVPVVTGTYTPAGLTAQALGPGLTKGKTEIWSVKSTGPFGKLAQIEVKEGCTTEIDAGPPFTVRAIVGKAVCSPALPTKAVSVSLAVVGKAGEQYAMNSMKRGLTLAPAPQLQIVDEKGAVLAQGSFEYG
jgi:hypothetical protein